MTIDALRFMTGRELEAKYKGDGGRRVVKD